MEILEGKNHPKETPGDTTNATGNKNGLIPRLKNILHTTGKVVVIEIRLFNLQVLMELMKVVVFAATVVQKLQ